jgi:hypothetical protein
MSALSSDGLRLRVDLSVQWRYHPPSLRQLFLTLPPDPPTDPPPTVRQEGRSRSHTEGAWGQTPDNAGGVTAAAFRLVQRMIRAQIGGSAPASDETGRDETGRDGIGGDGTGGDEIDGDGTGGDETGGSGGWPAGAPGGSPAVWLPGARVLSAVVSSVSQSVLTGYAMHQLFEQKRHITEHVRAAVADAASPYGILVESAQLVQVQLATSHS